MPNYLRANLLITGTAVLALSWGQPCRPLWAAPPKESPAPAAVERPKWQLGDHWILETLTDRIQGGEPVAASKPVPVRWEFRVAKFEKVHGRDCFRLEVECLNKGASGPKSTLWCDRETLFLRQFQTQVVFKGSYRTLQESYDCAKGQFSPVLASVNVLPLAFPAFLPPGAKGDSFSYVSQPLAAGAKDPSVIRFSHHVKQEIVAAGAKSLEKASWKYSKAVEGGAVSEVRLTEGSRTVVQLWRKGSPWPVYSENGRTRAWLVPATHP